MAMSNTMRKYLADLELAEFGDDDELEPNAKEQIKLLKRALNWKSHANLQHVCTYLGAEDDERVETPEGCREIIQEDIDCLKEDI